MTGQGVLPGCERLFAPEWTPRPHIVAKIESYFRGFKAHSRACFARRKHIAKRIGIAVRTLARYLRWFSQTGRLETIKRTARMTYRQLKDKVQVTAFAGPSLGPSIEVKPEAKSKPAVEEHTTLSTVQEAHANEPEGDAPQSSRTEAGDGVREHTSQAAEGEKPPSGAPGSTPEPPRRDPVPRWKWPDQGESLHQQRRTGPPLVPLGYCEQFRRYIGIFIAAGLPLCTMDLHRAHAAWTGTDPGEWEAATQDALRMCQTRAVRYIQYPVNHLQMQPWTRVAMERVLPEPEKPKSRWQTMWEELMS